LQPRLPSARGHRALRPSRTPHRSNADGLSAALVAAIQAAHQRRSAAGLQGRRLLGRWPFARLSLHRAECSQAVRCERSAASALGQKGSGRSIPTREARIMNTNRVLILGLDGATWSVLDPMRARGHMPNLDALFKSSAYGSLRSTIPPVTTAAWTTMMTGCGPARHGVFDHRYYDAAEGRMKVNHSGRIRVPTLWHLIAGTGRSIVCLNVPGLYPPLQVP